VRRHRRPLLAAGWLLLSIPARVALLLAWPLAWFGWEGPALYAWFFVLLCDESATQEWDGV
jgi:hypothetical protein